MRYELLGLLVLLAGYGALLYHHYRRRTASGPRRTSAGDRGRVIPFPGHRRERGRVRRSG